MGIIFFTFPCNFPKQSFSLPFHKSPELDDCILNTLSDFSNNTQNLISQSANSVMKPKNQLKQEQLLLSAFSVDLITAPTFPLAMVYLKIKSEISIEISLFIFKYETIPFCLTFPRQPGIFFDGTTNLYQETVTVRF
jgi:hypothetical protein